MLKIRLSRTGKRNSASFRIVVTEHYKPVKSGFIEHIGFYIPQSKLFQIDKEKLRTWIKKGATPSTTVNNLLVREKIFAKDKLVKVTRVPKKKEKEEKEAKTKKDKKTTKKEIKEESISAETKPEKTTAKDKKPEVPKADKKTEKKKPEVDKK